MVEMSNDTLVSLLTANISSWRDYDSRYRLNLKHMFITVYIISRQCMISVHCLLIMNSNWENHSEVSSCWISSESVFSTSPRLVSSYASSAEAVASSEKVLMSSPCDPCSGLLGADITPWVFLFISSYVMLRILLWRIYKVVTDS